MGIAVATDGGVGGHREDGALSPSPDPRNGFAVGLIALARGCGPFGKAPRHRARPEVLGDVPPRRPGGGDHEGSNGYYVRGGVEVNPGGDTPVDFQ
jgi:hypothetical protein